MTFPKRFDTERAKTTRTRTTTATTTTIAMASFWVIVFVLTSPVSAVVTTNCPQVGGAGQHGGLITNEESAKKFLTDYNDISLRVQRQTVEQRWAIVTNQNANSAGNGQGRKRQSGSEANATLVEQWQQLKECSFKYNVSNMPQDVQRQFQIIRNIGLGAQTNTTKIAQLQQAIGNMRGIYFNATVCLGERGCLPLVPDLEDIMSNSRDSDLLTNVWRGWRDETGRKIRPFYPNYVELSNEAAQLAGYQDLGDYWRSTYDMPTLESDIQTLYEQVSPLYKQLHAYIRRKLRTVYGEDSFPESGHIPAHLLGDMWGQLAVRLNNLTKPFTNKASLDVTEEMKRQNYTVLKMFQTADLFYQSLGMEPMVPKFWEKSMFTKPTDGRVVQCAPAAFNFYTDDDFRIKMCAEVSHQFLDTIYHEMGHIQYFMNYKHQPFVYRDAPNKGFHEATGDVISMSFNTPEHLASIGLLRNYVYDNETDINFLMKMAMSKVWFLPYGYMVDKWRWSVFRGDTPATEYNKAWWELRSGLQGLSTPVVRTEEDFDAGALLHVPLNIPYIRYFVANVLQFQFHKALCDIAGHTGPLHHCDISNSTAAGAKFKELLKMGKSKTTPEALLFLTGQTKLVAGPILDYFQPLMTFLENENGEDVGWNEPPAFNPLSPIAG